jgi:hypothetical protein
MNITPTLGLPFKLSFGMAGLTASNSVAEAKVSSLKEARTYQGRVIPLSAAAVDSWKSGEKLSFGTTGAVYFKASAGAHGLALGATYLAQGNWLNSLEKSDEFKVKVSRKHAVLNMLFLTGSVTHPIDFAPPAVVPIVQLSAGAFRNADEGFSFEYDIRSASGRAALDSFLKGDIVLSQELIDSADPAVLSAAQDENLSHGFMKAVVVGIPQVGFVKKKSASLIQRTYEDLKSGERADAIYSLRQASSDTRLFDNQKGTAEFFYSANIESPSTKDTYAQFVHTYRDTDGDRDDVRSSLRKLIQTTGLVSELKVDNVNSLGERDATVELEFALQLSDKALRSFESLPDELGTWRNFASEVFAEQDRVLSGSDRDAVCGLNPLCDVEMKTQTRFSIVRFRDFVHQAKVARETHHRMEWANAWAGAGQELSKSPALFSAVFRDSKDSGSLMRFRLGGTRFKMIEKVQSL